MGPSSALDIWEPEARELRGDRGVAGLSVGGVYEYMLDLPLSVANDDVFLEYEYDLLGWMGNLVNRGASTLTRHGMCRFS